MVPIVLSLLHDVNRFFTTVVQLRNPLKSSKCPQIAPTFCSIINLSSVYRLISTNLSFCCVLTTESTTSLVWNLESPSLSIFSSSNMSFYTRGSSISAILGTSDMANELYVSSVPIICPVVTCNCSCVFLGCFQHFFIKYRKCHHV